MAIGELAMHTAQLPLGITMLVESLDADMPDVPRTMPASRTGLLEALARGVDHAAQTCHHRGQLTVYLRLLDIPVPAIYGPSADENPFAT